MKPSASFVAIVAVAVAVALALFGSLAPMVAKAQAVPHPEDCIEWRGYNRLYGDDEPYHTYLFMNICDHDVLVTFIYHGNGLAWPGGCRRGNEKWGLPNAYLAEREVPDGRDRAHRWFPEPDLDDGSCCPFWRQEYLRLRGPVDPSVIAVIDDLDMETISWYDAHSIFTKADPEFERKHTSMVLTGDSCPENRSEVRWCTEWADLERQKQFEKENNLRGGCREYNIPNWSDAAAKNAAVTN